jgi:CBS domain-containing protein
MAIRVRDIMTTDVATVDPEMSLLELDEKLRKRRIGGAPVVEDGKLVGIVSRSDVARQLDVEESYAETLFDLYQQTGDGGRRRFVGGQLAERLAALRVRDAMIRAVDRTGPDTPIAEAARRMLAERHRRLLVTDEAGAVIGIVSATDLVRLIADGRVTERGGGA